MKLALISDTHDNWTLISKALEIIQKEDCKLLIHCGDISAPITLEFIADNFKGPFHFCFGNVDGDKLLSYQKIQDKKNVICHGSVLGELEVENKKIAFQHYPQIAENLALTQKYDYVFYGHTHKFDSREIGKTKIINPGNLCNIKHPPSFVILDLKSGKLQKIDF